MPTQIMYKGDRKPDLVANLTDSNGKCFNLDDPSIEDVLLFVGLLGSTPFVNGAVMSIVDAEHGQVRYEWGPSDTLTIGTFDVYIKIVYTGGRTLTAGDMRLEVQDSL